MGSHGAVRKYELVSGSYYRVLGVQAVVGRILNDDDDGTEGAHPVCVISNSFWQRRFNGDRNVVGRTLTVNDVRLQIVGVSDPGFFGSEIHKRYPMQIPMSMTQRLVGESRDSAAWEWVQIMARIEDGLPQAQVQQEIDFLGREIQRNLSAGSRQPDNAGSRFHLKDGAQGFDEERDRLQQPAIILAGGATLLFIMVLANLCAIVQSRAIARAREIEICLSLGATRGRILRRFLAENALLAVVGGIGAVCLCSSFLNALMHFLRICCKTRTGGSGRVRR